MVPELFFYAGSNLLEGPLWSAKENAIYCVAIDQCLIYKIDVNSKEVRTHKTESQVGCVVLSEEGFIMSAEKNGLFKINTETGERCFITQLETNAAMRYNDGKLDPIGRFLVGTKGYGQEFEEQACLYSFDGKESKKIIEGITISNGIGFSKDGSNLYFIDTPIKKVGKYFYDIEKGTAVFDKYIIEIPDQGFPDGMCTDVDDMIWVAEWEGGKICKWNPNTGEKIQEIQLPCKRVTSCCLGGENLEYLIITTAKDDDNYEPLAGGLFRVKIR